MNTRWYLSNRPSIPVCAKDVLERIKVRLAKRS